MIRRISLNNDESVREIFNLQMRSYLLEAELIGSYEIPPLNETQDELRKCRETFYGFYHDGRLAGMVSYKLVTGVLDIHRLAVDPDFLRKGIGRALLEYAEKINPVRQCVVCTGKENSPALNLYKSCGYRISREIKTVEGQRLVELIKIRN